MKSYIQTYKLGSKISSLFPMDLFNKCCLHNTTFCWKSNCEEASHIIFTAPRRDWRMLNQLLVNHHCGLIQDFGIRKMLQVKTSSQMTRATFAPSDIIRKHTENKICVRLFSFISYFLFLLYWYAIGRTYQQIEKSSTWKRIGII